MKLLHQAIRKGEERGKLNTAFLDRISFFRCGSSIKKVCPQTVSSLKFILQVGLEGNNIYFSESMGRSHGLCRISKVFLQN